MGLANWTYGAVISGTTITPGHAAIVLFSDPYLAFNQGVAVNRERTLDASAESDFGAADNVGTGHKWRLIDDQPWRRFYVVLQPGAHDAFVPNQ